MTFHPHPPLAILGRPKARGSARLSSWLRAWLPVLAFAVAAGALQAGQPCPEKPADKREQERNLALATMVRDRLEASGATVAYVARAGIDLRQYGLVYSHIGLAWRDHPKGRWATYHLLNTCGTRESELVDQTLEDFYNVDLFSRDALVAIPSPEVQVRLLNAFFSPMAPTLHERAYSMISNPFSVMYQSSNQWVLEVSAVAFAPPNVIHNRLQAQNWLKASGYAPFKARVSGMLVIGSTLFSPHVRFDDHDAQERSNNMYLTTTADSVLDFVQRLDPGLARHPLKQ
jgi:hypothetical protein